MFTPCFFLPSNSINSAMPALLTCPAASELAAPGGPEIDVGEVIRKNLERTRSQEGWIAVWADISIYLMHIDSCMQDLAHAEMVSPSSSASEMEPVKDPNQRWLNSKKKPFSVLTERTFRLCIWGLLQNHLQTRRIWQCSRVQSRYFYSRNLPHERIEIWNLIWHTYHYKYKPILDFDLPLCEKKDNKY